MAADNTISLLQSSHKLDNVAGVAATYSAHATSKRQRLFEIFAMDAADGDDDDSDDGSLQDEMPSGDTGDCESPKNATNEVAIHYASSTRRQSRSWSCAMKMNSRQDVVNDTNVSTHEPGSKGVEHVGRCAHADQKAQRADPPQLWTPVLAADGEALPLTIR